MFDPAHVYALDIETDNSPGRNGLDPANSSITEACLVTDPSVLGGGVVFQGTECEILDGLQNTLAELPAGLIVTWNGTFFDFPFINDRVLPSGMWQACGLRLTEAPSLRPKYDAMPGHATETNPGGGYQVTWEGDGGDHAHLDVAQAYRRFADESETKWSLKPVCAALGIEMFEIDRTRLQDYSVEDRRRYVLSDGRGTRELALRVLGMDYTPYR